MLINELNTYLTAQMPGKAIVNNFFREDSDDQIVILDLGGRTSIRSGVIEKTFEIYTRSKTYTVAETDIQTIYSLIEENDSILTTPTQIVKVEKVPAFMGQDEKSRFIFMSSFFIRAGGL